MTGRRSFVVAAAQMRCRESVEENAAAVVGMMRRAARRGASWLVTPEMILTGYHGRFDQRQVDRVIDDVIVPACREHRMTLILGTGKYSGPGRPFIHALVIGPDGRRRGGYSKTVPTGGDLKWCRAGRVADLRVFEVQGLRFGITICNDFWCTPVFTTLPDPHLVARWAKRGARVVFHLVNSGHDRTFRDFHTTRMEERAARAGIWVVSASAVSDPRRPVNAPTGILGPDGRWRAMAPGVGERLLVGRIPV